MSLVREKQLPGYELSGQCQQTEIGELPIDWELVRLGKLIQSAEYGSSAKSNPSGAIPVLRMGNIQDGRIDWDDLVFTDDQAEISKYGLQTGDVLFNRTNTIDLVGKTSIYLGSREAIFAGYLIRVNVDTSKLNARFLNYVMNTEFAKKHSLKVLSVAVGQANINAQKLKTYPIPLPPTLTEQEAIASALGDADALIESLEQLLAKKRLIKQGAMQELLTGQRRLPGFADDWETVTVRDVCTLVNGRGFKPHEWGETGLPIIRIQNLNGSQEFNYFEGDFNNKLLVQHGDLLFAWSGSRGTSFGPHIWWGQQALLNYHTWKLDLHSNRIRKDYFSFYLRVLTEEIEDAAHGASALVHTQKGEMEKYEVKLPSLTEQKEIAKALSALDSELSDLERKLTKSVQIKRAMMQQLLTGRIRLV